MSGRGRDADPSLPHGTEVAIHTVPLPGESKALIFVEANSQAIHVPSLAARPARALVVGLLDALDVAAPVDGRDDLAAPEGSEDDSERG